MYFVTTEAVIKCELVFDLSAVGFWSVTLTYSSTVSFAYKGQVHKNVYAMSS